MSTISAARINVDATAERLPIDATNLDATCAALNVELVQAVAMHNGNTVRMDDTELAQFQ